MEPFLGLSPQRMDPALEKNDSYGRIDAQRRQYSALAAAAPPQQIASVLLPLAGEGFGEVSVDHSIEL